MLIVSFLNKNLKTIATKLFYCVKSIYYHKGLEKITFLFLFSLFYYIILYNRILHWFFSEVLHWFPNKKYCYLELLFLQFLVQILYSHTDLEYQHFCLENEVFCLSIHHHCPTSTKIRLEFVTFLKKVAVALSFFYDFYNIPVIY